MKPRRYTCWDTRAVKGAGLKLRWQGLRGFKSHSQHHRILRYYFCLETEHPILPESRISNFETITVAAKTFSGNNTSSKISLASVSKSDTRFPCVLEFKISIRYS